MSILAPVGSQTRTNCSTASNEKTINNNQPTRLVPNTRFNRNAYGGIRQGNSATIRLRIGEWLIGGVHASRNSTNSVLNRDTS